MPLQQLAFGPEAVGVHPTSPALPALYHHQEDAISFLLQGSGLLFHDMGLGKTRAALLAVQRLQLPLIVVCPAIAKQVWVHEANLVSWPGPTVVLEGLTLKTIKQQKQWQTVRLSFFNQPAPALVILNWDVLYAHQPALLELLGEHRAILCLDESHKVRNPQNRWTKAVRPLALLAERTWCLSGTAMVNSALDLYWQLGLFGRRSPFAGMRLNDFGFKYCEKKWNPFKGKAGGFDFHGVKDEDGLLRMCAATVQRRRKVDCLDLPQKLRLALYVGRSSKPAGGFGGPAGAHLAALRNALSAEKARATIKYLEEQLEERPVIVFGWHRDFLERVSRHFEAPMIHGDTSSVQRQAIMRAYEAGQIPVLVGQIQAMGLAVTLVRGRHAVFGELHWSAVDLRQAEDRLHRPGQEREVTIHYLLYEGGVDQVVWETALRKGNAIDRLDQAAVNLDQLIEELRRVV